MSSNGEFLDFVLRSCCKPSHLVDVPPELADLLKPVGDITRKEPLVVIKTEPVDDDDIEQPVPVVGQPKRRKLSPEEYLARSQSIESRSSEGSNRSQNPVPGSHFQAVSPTYPNVPQPGPSWSRDPRLQRGNSNDQLRQAFLNRQLSAENIINATEKDASCPQSAVLRNAYHLARDGHELLTQASHAPRSFHAVIPSGHLLPGGYEQKRSPLIASNHNSLFVCQATAANIGDALAGQRYRKIPQDLQATGQTLGVDLDRVASGMGRDHTDNKRRMTTETSFAVNKRTIGMQSDPSQTEDRETQTTNNTEAFEYFIPNVRALTQKQRDALAVFKEVGKKYLI